MIIAFTISFGQFKALSEKSKFISPIIAPAFYSIQSY